MELFHVYKIEILDQIFNLEQGGQTLKTARIFMYDKYGNHIGSMDFGLVFKEDIYEAIRREENLNLDNCYLKNFSISEYRGIHNLSLNANVSIKEFSAVNAFFDADYKTDFSYCHFTGSSVNLSNSYFSGSSLDFLHTKFEEGDKDFSGSKFSCKEINFQYAHFNAGKVSFRDTVFKSEIISFVNADFSDGNINFSNIDFGSASVNFQFAQFSKGDISFEKSKFNGIKLDFSKVEFGDGRVDFRLCEFGDGDIYFDECEVNLGKLKFRRAKFGNGKISFEMAAMKNAEILFERTDFGVGELSFYQCECGSVNFDSSHFNNYVDLRFAYCGFIDLSNTIVRDIVDLTNEKGRVRIEQINFSGMRNLGRLFLDWHDNDVKRLIHSQKDTSIKLKAEQFRMIKEEFRALGQYSDEDKAYLEFKRLELTDRKNRLIKANKYNALWFYPLYLSEKLIFDQIGHYATNPLRVLVSMIISFAFMTFVYILLILTTSSDIVSSLGDPDKLSLISKSIYHSIVTFLTIGYGDYYPSGIIRWVSGVEGFVGLFLMSYFTVAFVRKVLR